MKPCRLSTGEECLALFRSHWQSIDLVILDLGMPGMGGKRALKELLQIDSEVKVLISSGYAQKETVAEVLEAGAKDFVAKPFMRDELLIKVTQLTQK